MKNRKDPEPEQQFVISAPASGGNLISAPRLSARGSEAYNLHVMKITMVTLLYGMVGKHWPEVPQEVWLKQPAGPYSLILSASCSWSACNTQNTVGFKGILSLWVKEQRFVKNFNIFKTGISRLICKCLKWIMSTFHDMDQFSQDFLWYPVPIDHTEMW